MSRTSGDDVDSQGVIRNGFDYAVQVWVDNYICQPVGLGEAWAGKDIREVPGHEERRPDALLAE